MKPSPPFVYKPGGSTLHRDVTPAQNIPRYDSFPSPLSSLFALTLSALYSYPSRIFTTLWEEAPPTDFHVSRPIKFKFKQKHFFPIRNGIISAQPLWQWPVNNACARKSQVP